MHRHTRCLFTSNLLAQIGRVHLRVIAKALKRDIKVVARNPQSTEQIQRGTKVRQRQEKSRTSYKTHPEANRIADRAQHK